MDKPNSIDAAWSWFARDIPEMDNEWPRQRFFAGASAALSIIYRRGFENLERELQDIQQELEQADG